MSERQLREGIECHLCPEEAECYLCNKARKALAQPPDLAALLRKMREMWDQPLLGSDGASVLNELAEYIEKTVRLTDDGWEWVEDDESGGQDES